MMLYMVVKKLLEDNHIYRNSDKELLWAVWMAEKAVVDGVMTKDGFLTASIAESVTRVRRQIQKANPDLQANVKVKRLREKRAKQKGTHVFREALGAWDKD